ncbi:putative PurR-regulated permease PerM [Sphingomonas zeicaulis]|uniref:AI-2E family transporter n=1 Tax=Sphingomonas zeicaulis TaxID=1632740 RepID=UPI003D1FFCDF
MSDRQSTREGWSYGRVAVVIVMLIAIVGVASLLTELTRLFMLVFAAIVIATIFDALARKLCDLTKIPRGLALLIAVFALLGIFVGVFTLFGSQLVQQFDTIRQSLPPAIANVEAQLNRFGIGDQVRSLFDQGSSDLSALATRAGSYVLAAGSGVADFVLVLVGAIFLASDPAVYRRGLVMMMPQRAEGPVAQALDDASRGLRGWMIGQAVSSVVVALLTWLGLMLLGVPAAGGLGLIAGLLDVIPMVGPIVAGIPAVLLAFTVSPATALWTIVLFLIIQQIQGNFLQPMIQKQAVDVPPAVLLFAVVGAGMLFGALGVLLAAPLTVVVYVFVQRIYVRTLLNKPIRIAGEG